MGSKNSQTTPTTTSTNAVRQLLGAADAPSGTRRSRCQEGCGRGCGRGSCPRKLLQEPRPRRLQGRLCAAYQGQATALVATFTAGAEAENTVRGLTIDLQFRALWIIVIFFPAEQITSKRGC